MVVSNPALNLPISRKQRTRYLPADAMRKAISAGRTWRSSAAPFQLLENAVDSRRAGGFWLTQAVARQGRDSEETGVWPRSHRRSGCFRRVQFA
jgi:hypothetical protein